MGKVGILAGFGALVFGSVALAIALGVATDAWKSDQHVRGLVWTLISGICVLLAGFCGALPAALDADKNRDAGPIVNPTVTTQAPIIAPLAPNERPYLMVQSVSFTDVLEVGKNPKSEIRFVNSGKTPAVDSMFVSQMGWVQAGKEDDLFGPDKPIPQGGPKPSVMSIGPGVVFGIVGKYVSAVNTAEFVEQIKAGTKGIYAYGYVDYDDINGDPWHVRFCFKADPEALHAASACKFWNDVGKGRLYKPKPNGDQ